MSGQCDCLRCGLLTACWQWRTLGQEAVSQLTPTLYCADENYCKLTTLLTTVCLLPDSKVGDSRRRSFHIRQWCCGLTLQLIPYSLPLVLTIQFVIRINVQSTNVYEDEPKLTNTQFGQKLPLQPKGPVFISQKLGLNTWRRNRGHKWLNRFHVQTTAFLWVFNRESDVNRFWGRG